MFLGQIALVLAGSWLLDEPASHARPFANRSFQLQLFVIVLVMPFVETIIGQWLPIRLINGGLHRPWRLAGFVSAIAFTGLHGYTDRAAVSVFLGAVVLAAVFVTEAKKSGRPVLSTFLTHAFASAFVQVLRILWRDDRRGVAIEAPVSH